MEYTLTPSTWKAKAGTSLVSSRPEFQGSQDYIERPCEKNRKRKEVLIKTVVFICFVLFKKMYVFINFDILGVEPRSRYILLSYIAVRLLFLNSDYLYLEHVNIQIFLFMTSPLTY